MDERIDRRGAAPADGRPGGQPGGQLLRNLVWFGRLLRGAGIVVTPEQVASLARALGHVDLARRGEVEAAAAAVLVGRREHLDLFRRAFELFWRRAARQGDPIELGRMLRRVSRGGASGAVAAAAGEVEDSSERLALRAASAVELLKTKDFAALSAEEERQVVAWLRRQPWRVGPRRTRRKETARRGAVLDVRRLLRRSLRHGGEVIDLAWRRRRLAPRPLVALADISGSMEPYSRLLLKFLYALGGATQRYHAFAFGTRLTPLGRQLARRDIDRALAEAAAAIVDWGGGTRIGDALERFNYDWGRRVLGQGAVVLLISDGWDRGEPEQLRRQMERLARGCQRLIWLNPLLGIDGYQPLTRGMQAALPYIDDFLPVHNLASLEQLGRLLARLDDDRPAGWEERHAGRS